MCTSEVLRAPPLRLPALRALRPLMLMMRPNPWALSRGMAGPGAAQRPDELHVEVADQVFVDEVLDGTGGRRRTARQGRAVDQDVQPAQGVGGGVDDAVDLLAVGGVKGHRMARRPVVSAISAAVASRSGMEREPTTTSAPSRASSSAIALPMPRLAPPTNANLPSSPKSMGIASVGMWDANAPEGRGSLGWGDYIACCWQKGRVIDLLPF